MEVWILQTGEPLHIDEGNPRPMRAMNLANALNESGHKVVLWSSGFYHQEKRHRRKKFSQIKVSELLEIRLIPSPGYKRNIGFGRLWDHVVLAYRLRKLLKQEREVPDIAFIGYPPIETAFVMTSWLASRHVPSVIDVKDQWPSIFIDSAPRLIRPIFRSILFPYFYMGQKTIQQSTSVSSMAKSFLNWSISFANRESCKHDIVVPLTTKVGDVSEGSIQRARDYWDEIGIFESGSTRLCFVGSLSPAFDFIPVYEAAKKLHEKGSSCSFVICGEGGSGESIKKMMADLPNVFFPGWIDRPQIVALSERSNAALLPYNNDHGFDCSLPNKVLDSLSLGLPLITPLQGELTTLIELNAVGFIYGAEKNRSLFDCIEELTNDSKNRSEMSSNAKKLYQNRFSFQKVYGGLVRHLEQMVNEHKQK